MPPRRRLPTGAIDVESPRLRLPQAITLDTSFVVDALISSQPRHRQAAQFLNALTVTQATIIFNRLLEVELLQAAIAIEAARGGSRSKWRKRFADGRVRRRVGRFASAVMERWANTIAALPAVCVELAEVTDDLAADCAAWGLESYDAVHARTAVYSRANAIATADHAFARMSNSPLAVFTYK